MIVAGIGCRRGASCEAVIDAVEAALAQSGVVQSSLSVLAIPEDKRTEAGIFDAARHLSLGVVVVSHASLLAASKGALTSSARVQGLKGVPSVAETAALAAAGDGARLIAPRSATRTVTCALAAGGGT